MAYSHGVYLVMLTLFLIQWWKKCLCFIFLLRYAYLDCESWLSSHVTTAVAIVHSRKEERNIYIHAMLLLCQNYKNTENENLSYFFFSKGLYFISTYFLVRALVSPSVMSIPSCMSWPSFLNTQDSDVVKKCLNDIP